MFNSIPHATLDRLWLHQQEALRFATQHLRKYDTPCLIRMPTGTGKTGVIACLSMVSNRHSTLLLTPWAHLRKQMHADLTASFWKQIEQQAPSKRVVELLPSEAHSVVKPEEPTVYVATFATLNELRTSRPKAYDLLKEAVSLVLVDEGHYEPAVEWGRSVKGIGARSALFTATPYRNDLKLFRIDDPTRSTHHFTHAAAVNTGIIRDLQVHVLGAQPDIPSLSSAFVKMWKQLRAAGTLPSRDPRAIVNCSGALDIELAVTHLRRAGLDAIGIHEQFANRQEHYLLETVPTPTSVESAIWVHQHKLTEGLDDSRFCCVALFTQIRNDRKLVQQIGRVLRRKATDGPGKAVLLVPPHISADTAWDSYRAFEQRLELLEPQHFRNVVDNLLRSQPAVEYFDGKFRKRFDPYVLDRDAQVIVPPSVLVRRRRSDFSLSEYIEECTDTLNIADAVILGPDMFGPCQRGTNYALWVYASLRNSRLLRDTSFYEIQLETHCVVEHDGFVLVADSRGLLPAEYLERCTGFVSPDRLARFLDNGFTPTNVSLDSSIPFDTVIRGAEFRGSNLLRIPASLTDRVQICRSARGTSGDRGRRYVGFSNGRLRKESSIVDRNSFDVSRFVNWAQETAEGLNGSGAASPLFKRYMPTCNPPDTPLPRTICLDLISLDVDLALSDGTRITFASSSAEVTSTKAGLGVEYVFTLTAVTANGDAHGISFALEYQDAKQRFWIRRRSGPSVRVSTDEDNEASGRTLPEFLNQRQDAILIGLDGGEMVYQGRRFYRVDYTYAADMLVDLIERPNSGLSCYSEKGTREEIEKLKASKVRRFPNGSLFRAIADENIEFPFQSDIVVCTDLGTECADFVAGSVDERQLALIHAKCGKGFKISASAFHDVVAQAMKNFGYLMKGAPAPSNASSWSAGKYWNGSNVPRLYKTVGSLPTGKRLWNALRSSVIESSDPALYVCLVTSGCCDKRELLKAAKDPSKRTPEMAQLVHLLDGLISYGRQVGLKIVVYDIPYEVS